ncbi:MAG TPA: hypothetical protein GX708_15500 [Gallicola sp.]|nr:hypothetical protein [Gallicola sp.]
MDQIKTKNEAFFASVSQILFLTIIPLVLTILSISLSLQDNEIYGLNIKEFRKFPRAQRYNFLQMIVISLILIIINLILQFFDLLIAKLFLNLIVVVYIFLFIFNEIPFLTKSDYKVNRIIRYQYHEFKKKMGVLKKSQRKKFLHHYV